MNVAIHRISLDIHNTSSQTSISVKRGDTARGLHITLTENGKPYKIADGCSAVFRMKKPADDNGYRAIVYNECIIEGNTIAYTLTSSNTEIVGAADCEITLYGADKEVITSPHFSMVIADTVNTDGEVETIGHNELTALVNATAEAKAVTIEVETKLANGDFVGEKGADGQNGKDGVSITKTEINDKGELVITRSDNTISNLGVVVDGKNLVFNTEAQLKSWVFGHGKNFVDPNNFEMVDMGYTEPEDIGSHSVGNDGRIYLSGSLNESYYVANKIILPVGTYHLSIYIEDNNNGAFELANLIINDEKIRLDVFSNHIEDPTTVNHTFILEEDTEVTLELGCTSQARYSAMVQIEEGEQYTGFEPFAGPYVRADGKTPADLQIGDNLYVVELGVPDYWWDGQTIQPIEAANPDLSNYYTKEEIDTAIGDIETALTEVVTEQENIIVAMDSFIGGDSV